MSKVIETLKSINEWRKTVDWKNLTLWLRDSSLTTFITLMGVVNSKKLSEVIPGLPDVDLTQYLNMPFWAKVMKLSATVFVFALIANRWIDKATWPQTPINKPPAL
jgi:hypothetical protein